jgi:hypothetical protein
MNKTPETSKAWDSVLRLPNGMYQSNPDKTHLAITMLNHSKKMEIDRNKWKLKFERLKELQLVKKY